MCPKWLVVNACTMSLDKSCHRCVLFTPFNHLRNVNEPCDSLEMMKMLPFQAFLICISHLQWLHNLFIYSKQLDALYRSDLFKVTWIMATFFSFDNTLNKFFFFEGTYWNRWNFPVICPTIPCWINGLIAELELTSLFPI